MATTTAQNSQSAAEASSAMRNGQMARYPNGRFAAFVDDDDDHDDHDDRDDKGGGVMLRDFEDDSHTSGGSIPTPMGTQSSSASSGNVRAARPRKNDSTVTFSDDSKPAAMSRRNTIAPIGTGRYTEYTENANGGASLNASDNAWNPGSQQQQHIAHRLDQTSEKTTGHEAVKKSNSAGQVGSSTPAHVQNQANMVTNVHSQTGPDQAAQFGYSTNFHPAATMNTPGAMNTPSAMNNPGAMNTPSGHRAMQYPQSTRGMGYPWGNNYNPAGASYNTPQSTGYRAAQRSALGANFPSTTSDATPSHMPNKAGRNPAITPQSESAYSQYNQTEPRNFAPRAGDARMSMPPPAFNLGRPGFSKGPNESQYRESEYSESQYEESQYGESQYGESQYGESQYRAPDSDPFMSPTHKHANGHNMSQALMLASVPEENQLALATRQMAHGPAPAEVRAVRSDQLNRLTDGPMGLPTQDVALNPDNFPFIESTTQAAPVGHGVVKIRNIPFGTKRAEIIAFLGRNSKILNDNQEPVHIIMERVSSKTQDCYVEFMTTQDAVRSVDRHRENLQRGRASRLGDRPVEVLLSSQAALMKDLFPLASGIWWDNAKPVIQAPIDGMPWKTFKGFVTEEEMTMLVKHVEIPQRSPYSKECPQRPYECMISTIKKLPWYMADRITLRQRHAIYEATTKLINLLKQALQRDTRNRETVINPQLMKRLATAAMLCPGFSVVQKDNIAVLSDLDQERARMFNQPRFADQWVHLHGICPRPGVPLDVLEWYVAIIREETTRYIHRKAIVERNEIQRTSCYTSLYFGYVWYEMGLPTGKDLENLSLHEVARRELGVIERAFCRAFPPANGIEEL